MKKIVYSIIVMFGLFATSSCEDMLMTGNDSMVTNPELDNKTDSVFYALGIAQAMQQLADQYFFIGEMRGELVTTTEHTDNNLRQLADYSATTSNRYDSAYVYYKVINNCNYYLAHRDTTLTTGSTNVTINEYAAVEAWRAWAYLQLARTYGGNERGIPFYTEPLTTISQIESSNFPELTLTEIVAELAPSLEKYSGLQVSTFGTNSYSVGNTNWGLAKNINPELIFVPVDVILGEMYLEDGQWLKAAQHYCKYLCDNKLTSNDYTVFRMFGEEALLLTMFPADFERSYQSLVDSYTQIFNNSATPADVLTYIPMAVSSQRGQTTNVPLAFGYDYYSTESASACPRAENVQIAPSATYYALTNDCDVYYYPKNMNGTTLEPNPNNVKAWKGGDGRACYTRGSLSSISNYEGILNRDAADTTKIYIGKAHKNANVYLFRTSTIYLHLAEALNRLGHPDAAFAILRNGISTYLEQLIPGADGVYAAHQYMTKESVDLLTTKVPFLNDVNRTVFIPENTYGIHHHGGGFTNGKGIENNMSVKGSQATAVGSRNNLYYLPQPIIGAKMQELSEQFGLQMEMSKQDSINAMEDILCDEYAKEFAFEGIRFYDLQRIARHKNEAGLYGSDFGSIWFADKLKNNNPQVDLTEPKNWYLSF
jgi:hypothetical protein